MIILIMIIIIIIIIIIMIIIIEKENYHNKASNILRNLFNPLKNVILFAH